MNAGKLIAVCGIDGCGKTTQIQALTDWLRGRDIDVLQTRQPSDLYRTHPLVRAYLDEGDPRLGMQGLSLLAAADRQYHISSVIRPALTAGKWVITDRYVYSTFAFFTVRGLDIDFVRTINRGVPMPDLSILLDVPAEIARERVMRRDGTALKYEERSLRFMDDVRQAFLRFRDESFLTLDATTPTEQLVAVVREHCEERWFRTAPRAASDRP